MNFYWSELDTLSGQIYCTLDIFGYCTVIKQRVDLLHFGHCPYLGADSTIVLSLKISRQTFCVTGYIKDSRTSTFCVVECETGHKI